MRLVGLLMHQATKARVCEHVTTCDGVSTTRRLGRAARSGAAGWWRAGAVPNPPHVPHDIAHDSYAKVPPSPCFPQRDDGFFAT